MLLIRLKLCAMLLFLVGNVFAQPSTTLPSRVVDDSTSSVDVPELGLRIYYPSHEGSSPVLKRRQDIRYFILISDTRTTEVSIEFATRRAIKAYADTVRAMAKRSGSSVEDFGLVQTEEEFVHGQYVYQNNIVYDFFERFHDSPQYRYGLKTYMGETVGGFQIDAYRYLDSLQIIVRCYSRGDSVGNKVVDIFRHQLGLRENDYAFSLVDRLILMLIERDFLQVLRRIRFERL